jgi:hypothetical protein
MSWHVDGTLVSAYADGSLDHARAASVEAHVVSCAQCRGLIATVSDRARLDAVWTEVRDGMDRPRPRPVEWVLQRLGVRAHVARLVAATPSLTASWFIAVSVSLAWAVVAARGSVRGFAMYLIVTPLIPLIGVAFAYGPLVDPVYDLSLAAPMRKTRLLLLRAGTVLVSSIGITAVTSIFLPSVGWTAIAWLLPALGVSLTCLALSSWFEAPVAAGIVGAAWVTIATTAVAARGAADVERASVFTPQGQVAFACLAVAAVLVLASRARRFDTGEIR